MPFSDDIDRQAAIEAERVLNPGMSDEEVARRFAKIGVEVPRASKPPSFADWASPHIENIFRCSHKQLVEQPHSGTYPGTNWRCAPRRICRGCGEIESLHTLWSSATGWKDIVYTKLTGTPVAYEPSPGCTADCCRKHR